MVGIDFSTIFNIFIYSMDSIDFEVIKQLIKEKYPDKKEYVENLRLLYKRYRNSFYTPYASKYFYFYKNIENKS